MKKRELVKLGIAHGPPMKAAFEGIRKTAAAGLSRAAMRTSIAAVVEDPAAHRGDALSSAPWPRPAT